MPHLKPNGRTVRTFERDGKTISEVEFVIEDVGHCIGYVVGPNDGFCTLYASVERALEAVK